MKMGAQRLMLAACVGSLLGTIVLPALSAEPSGVGLHAERAAPEPRDGMYALDRYVIGKGQGDLSKGMVVCRRVAELSARADVAKQIRVLVKERLVDRVRERSGRGFEQDIELTREEIVQEYLQGVKIVDYRIDEEQKTCSATAVMPKE